MKKQDQKELVELFRGMHFDEKMLVLPNCWNGGSAKIFEKLGFKAIATSSAGIAFSKGLSDCEHIEINELLNVVKEIIKVINIPLSVDMERGYSDCVQKIKHNVKKIIEAGAVGINIEDGHYENEKHIDDLDKQIEKISAIAELREEMEIPFLINARCCIYWLQLGTEEERFEIAVERGKEYSAVGADCIFLPGLIDKKTVERLVKEIGTPINIIANPSFYDIDELNKIGVKRYSIGSGPARVVMNEIINIGKDLIEDKSIERILKNPLTYDMANEFFK